MFARKETGSAIIGFAFLLGPAIAFSILAGLAEAGSAAGQRLSWLGNFFWMGFLFFFAAVFALSAVLDRANRNASGKKVAVLLTLSLIIGFGISAVIMKVKYG